jgi:hypothetical protein
MNRERRVCRYRNLGAGRADVAGFVSETNTRNMRAVRWINVGTGEFAGHRQLTERFQCETGHSAPVRSR